MNDELNEDTLTAISMVTAALNQHGTDKQLTTQIANDYLAENPENGHTRILSGLVNLCVVLTVSAASATNRTPQQVIQDAAELTINWDQLGEGE